jgi:probable HAF family extracellular repeat protein
MLKHWKRTLTLLAVAAAVGLVSAGLALGKKPPKPPPEPPPLPPIRYSITFLGTLPGDATSKARDVNTLGEVVGDSRSADGVYRAFLYTDLDGDGAKEMVALNDLIDPDPEGDDWNLRAAFGINDFGQICGSGYLNGAVEVRAYRFSPGVDGAWPVVDDLGTFAGNYSSARAINDLGEVAGLSHDANGTQRAFVWTAEGGMVDIGDLGGRAFATGINNLGQVTGGSSIVAGESFPLHAFRYTTGEGMKDLGDFGYGGVTGVSDINDDGHVVGGALAVKYRVGIAPMPFYTPIKMA